MRINCLFFDDYETLDIFGPIEVLSRIDGAELRYISMDGGNVKSRQGFSIQTEAAESTEKGGILVIPGGMGTRKLVNDAAFISELKELCRNSEYVLTICTGSALLAKTGLIDGAKATSNKRAFDWVRSVSGDVDWLARARWASDGKYYTASGVSAGIDMALGFISDRYGAEKAEQIAAGIEYVWNRDKYEDPFARE
ncbi:MAG: DJ-1/PfpI family protein [Firmicutes bacterium]|nr:DJ-1/PfpI family protein [Bacillota bacterium]